MPESWIEYFSSELFMPHGHCYLWQPALVWLQVLANGAIATAYVAIFATLVYLVRRIEDIPFQWMYVCFAVFIVTCGFTHIFDVYVIWRPAYWLDGSVRAITAIASVGTAILLPPLVPKAVALAEAARVSHERGIKLEQANQEMATLLDRTQELEQLKTRFFANVSHELRTPLALILGPTQTLLQGGALSGDQRAQIEVVERNARLLLRHVNDLLDVAKLEAGKIEPDYVETDLGRRVRLVAANFDGLAQERSITYVIEVPPQLHGQFDAPKLERVVLNLLSNAFKFTPSGGHIRCVLRCEGDRVVIEVADSGPGVPPEQREAIFERFRQVEASSTRRFGGTGLGLAIAKDFVALHGGTIEVKDAPEGGALFRLELPLAAPKGARVEVDTGDEDVSALARQAVDELRAPRHALLPAPQGDNPLVLVVEDNPEMNRFVRESLEPEYRVESAFDGREGVSKAKALAPDLIVSDVMMPELSGDELVAEIRADDKLNDVPILMLTAKADDEIRVQVLRHGAQDYLMKPFALDELRARIGNLVTMKRVRDLLRRELATQTRDLEALAKEVTGRKRELETALASLRVAREQAEKASQMKTEFLGLVSHELRTPVTAVQLQLERLQRGHERMGASQQKEVLGRMSASVNRLVALVESLLDYTRIESGRLDTEIRDFDLLDIANEALEELRPQAEAKALTLNLKVDAQLGQARSDPRLVRIIVVNLLANAVKFTERGGAQLSIEGTAQGHRIVVSDTGPGIAAKERGRIFLPFQHIEPVRQKHTPGVGLGLALVRDLVTALGGTIKLESEPGRGSRFFVDLPSKPTNSSDAGDRTDDKHPDRRGR